jgi:hypothetical protein
MRRLEAKAASPHDDQEKRRQSRFRLLTNPANPSGVLLGLDPSIRTALKSLTFMGPQHKAEDDAERLSVFVSSLKAARKPLPLLPRRAVQCPVLA